MARLGLFPLPLVLVPTERVPLHIFEPRYRELIGECLDRGTEFGVLLAKPGDEPHAVGTRASVAEVLRRLPDGRMHIAVEGGERFRLLELHDDRAFLEGTVEPVTDVGVRGGIVHVGDRLDRALEERAVVVQLE